MNSIHHINALMRNRIKNTLKNMEVLLLFIVFPVIAAVMQTAIGSDTGMVGNVFTGVFGVMHCVFTPIVVTANIIAEEKEKHTLKVLLFSNVTLKEYLASTGGFVLLATMITSISFVAAGGYSGIDAFRLLLYLGIGCLVSIVLGSCIGLYSNSVTASNGIAVPVSMLFAFLPMLSWFNKDIGKVASITYGQQISRLIAGTQIEWQGWLAIGVNMLVFTGIAVFLYRRNRMH